MANIHGNELGIYINIDQTNYDAYADGATDTPFSFIDNVDDTEDNISTQDAGFTTVGGNWKLVACATSCSLNLSNATISDGFNEF